jgi:hypothetical protein
MASNLAIMEGQRRHVDGYYLNVRPIHTKRKRTNCWNLEQVGDSELGSCSVIGKLMQALLYFTSEMTISVSSSFLISFLTFFDTLGFEFSESFDRSRFLLGLAIFTPVNWCLGPFYE